MRELRDRVALVTGASRGLGRALALELAAQGAHLVLTARDAARLGQVAARIEALGVEVLALSADLTDPDDRRELVDESIRRFGRIDVLVNNAGIVRATEFVDEEPTRIYATNLIAPVALTRLVLPGMVERRRGHLLTVASIAGQVGVPYLVNYTASKAALIAFSHALRLELKGTGVSASVICPGFMDDEGAYAAYRTPTPWYLGTTTAEHVARAAVRALRRDRPDSIASPRPVRPLAVLRTLSPRLAHTMLDRLGLPRFMRALAAERLPYSG